MDIMDEVKQATRQKSRKRRKSRCTPLYSFK